MWVRKYERDAKKGVDSPIPTQVVSNEEILPRPQHKRQAQVEYLTGKWGEENAKKVGLNRRDFMRTSMGMATAIMAANAVYGPYWEVDAAEAVDPAATAEKYPKSDYFVIDAQSHFTNGYALGFRNQAFVTEGLKKELDGSADAYSLPNFVKEMLFDSDTNIVIISGVPDKETNKDAEGKVLEGVARSRGALPSWLMSQAKKDINELAGSKRAYCQGNCAPNHYWDKAAGKQDLTLLHEQMEREVKVYGIDSWKWYCHTDPARTGNGFQVDDEMSANFMEYSRKLGIKLISVHKGYSYQSRTLGHLANPKDIEKAALNNPDFNFVVYHSAIKHGTREPDFEKLDEFNPETGDFLWHSVLMDIKKRNPQINNVFCEIGSSFGTLAVDHPEMCQHLIGKNVKNYGSDHVVWGTDCLWWGSPQWAIELMYRFQITDKNVEKFGYKKLTKEDKYNIFGANLAKLYKIDIKEQRKALPADALTKLKEKYKSRGGQASNMAPGWVRMDA